MPTNINPILLWILGGVFVFLQGVTALVISMFRSDIKAIWTEIKAGRDHRDADQEKCHTFMLEMGKLKEAHDIMTMRGVHNRREGDQR